MLKTALALVAFTLSFSINAAILSVGSSYGSNTITRDTATSLDWLDLTETRGLQYFEVYAELKPGGKYEGWRFATTDEFDQLIHNFGYAPQISNCKYSVMFCDNGFIGIENDLIEVMIRTLGDTLDASLDAIEYTTDVPPDGAGFTSGMLAEFVQGSMNAYVATARIWDYELWNRFDQSNYRNPVDGVSTITRFTEIGSTASYTGSFLVAPSPVPIPAAAWLFASGIVVLFSFKHKQ